MLIAAAFTDMRTWSSLLGTFSCVIFMFRSLNIKDDCRQKVSIVF